MGSFMKSMPQLARNMEFWMCAMEAKTDACSAALQHSMLEDMYGKDDGSINWTEYGLPADKYELASVATMVLINSKSDMEKFICSFFETMEPICDPRPNANVFKSQGKT